VPAVPRARLQEGDPGCVGLQLAKCPKSKPVIPSQKEVPQKAEGAPGDQDPEMFFDLMNILCS